MLNKYLKEVIGATMIISSIIVLNPIKAYAGEEMSENAYNIVSNLYGSERDRQYATTALNYWSTWQNAGFKSPDECCKCLAEADGGLIKKIYEDSNEKLNLCLVNVYSKQDLFQGTGVQNDESDRPVLIFQFKNNSGQFDPRLWIVDVISGTVYSAKGQSGAAIYEVVNDGQIKYIYSNKDGCTKWR